MSRSYRWNDLTDKEKLDLNELYELKYEMTLDLYRARARRLEAVAIKERNSPLLDNWEYYLYKMFGTRFMGSLAFSLDPYWQCIDLSKKEFGLPKKLIGTLVPQVVAPVNRHTKFTAILPSQTLFKETKRNVASSNHLVFEGGTFRASGMGDSVSETHYSLAAVPFQLACYGWRHDTTWKTRNPGKKISRNTLKKLPNQVGEFELFVPSIKAESVSYGYVHSDTKITVLQGVGNPHPPTLTTKERDQWTGYTTGPVATVLDSTCQAYYAAEHIYAHSVMIQHLDKMMAQCVPNRRYFNLGYQIGELKDVPNSIKGTLHTWREVQKLLGTANFKTAANTRSWWTRENVKANRSALSKVLDGPHLDKDLSAAYLNFKFGWQSLFQAIQKMATSPQRAADDINKLVARNGKVSNLSYQIGWSEPVSSSPGLSLPGSTAILSIDDVNHPVGVSAVRDITLRCVANTGINFPQIDQPNFKMQLFLDKMGLSPTPADAYDLLPWTWLIDWFTGATDYIHLMDRVNGNRDIVNYALLTYKSLTRVKGVRQMYGQTTVGWKYVPPDAGVDPLHTETYKTWFNFTGELRMKYELRASVASLINQKTYSGLNLADDQKSILQALFTSFAK